MSFPGAGCVAAEDVLSGVSVFLLSQGDYGDWMSRSLAWRETRTPCVWRGRRGKGELPQALCLPDLACRFFFLREKLTNRCFQQLCMPVDRGRPQEGDSWDRPSPAGLQGGSHTGLTFS